jgi:hypothetical protein
MPTQAQYGAQLRPVFRYLANELFYMLRKLLLLLIPALLCTALLAEAVYQEPDDFLRETFSGKAPEPALIWLSGERKQFAEQLLGHRYPTLRVRYWRHNQRSAWVLEEIGKDLPITIGLVTNNGLLEQIKVLVFRESRGWEIRHPFFTDQFKGARLDEDNTLDRDIDGISGATLSVRAMKKMAALALFLDAELRKQDVAPSP